jgi:L-seryl-tRNA(Ser) seleniumtransferase
MNLKNTDKYGFKIDPSVGYARGPILQSSLEEAQRRLHALNLIRQRAASHGPDSFYNITGLHRDFPLPTESLNHAEEWIGPAFYWDELEDLARAHFGGQFDHEVVVLNRCSAGIIAACLALIKPGSQVISLVPGERSHPSIGRGIRLAGAQMLQMNGIEEVSQALDGNTVSFMVITGVSSELEVINQNIMLDAISRAHKADVPVLLDDAYGTRLRPIIYDQPMSLQTGANLAVTACDKAGMSGPRAGLMVGEKQYVELVNTKAAELGLEARSPLAAAVWASLKNFTPEELEEEVAFGSRVYENLEQKYGSEYVIKSAIGASLPAEHVYELVKEIRKDESEFPVCPAEITAAIGMHWLQKFGIISISALGQPGASIWLRFKPDPKVIARMGGLKTLIDAIDEGLHHVANIAHSVPKMKALILGRRTS